VLPGSLIPVSAIANSVYDGPITNGVAVWKVLSDGFGDTVSENGVVSIFDTNVSRRVQVACDYTFDGITKSDMIEFDVQRIRYAPTIMPADGTIIGDSQSVLISCADSNATIHYTLDGSEPTDTSAAYQKRFRISGKTTIKAIAVYEGWTNSEVVAAHYALGQCPNPAIVSDGGDVFVHGSMQVSIDWNCEDGVLRYTLDGSDVTTTSPAYTGPFSIDDTTTVKAKAFGETYFDSKQVELTVTKDWESVAEPVITAAETFTGGKTQVSISCATEGARILYTLDGSAPNAHSRRYSEPFNIRETTVVKAYATLTDYADSEVVAKTITKEWGVGDSVGLPDHKFTAEGNAGWVDDGGAAMKSGSITHNQKSTLQTAFVGKGRLTFELKTSCEEDDPAYVEYDRSEIWIDGVLKMKRDGVHDWTEYAYDLDEGVHTVEWKYVKDDLDESPYPGADCIWVRNIVWRPEFTCTTEVPVELAWIKEKYGDLGSYYYDYEDKAQETAANGHKVWECYVAGENPTDALSKFTPLIEMSDGTPVISWRPDLNEGKGKIGKRTYSILGSTDLENWDVVPDGQESDYNFFKVTVEMPH